MFLTNYFQLRRGRRNLIKNGSSSKLLSIYTEDRPNFDYHTQKLYKKESKNLHALSRISKYRKVNKRRLIL